MSQEEKNINSSTHPLSFDELSDAAQQKAISLYDPFMEYNWWDWIVDDWQQEMHDEYGVETDDIEWDDSFDVWFDGKVWDDKRFIEKVLPGEIEKSTNRFMRMEGDAEKENFWEDLYLTFVHYQGRTPSSKAMEIVVEDADEISDRLIDLLEQKGKEFAIEKAQELGKSLQSHWDYEHSEAGAIEFYQSNGTTFQPDGTPID